MVDHLEEFHGLPAFTFPLDDAPTRLPEPDAVAWRITVGRGEVMFEDAFAKFCAVVDTTRVRALIIGDWDAMDLDPKDEIETLTAARDRLPALRAVFLGDIVSEECELSWINQCDVTPLLAGFPDLEEFGLRGSQGLAFPALRHERLRKLVMQTGGLPAEVVRGVGASELPALEHLDLWLGTEDYGADHEVADLAPILSGARLPRLRHLALRNSYVQEEVAAAVASAPVVAQLDVLDLSMGIFGDHGAAALLGGQPLTHLKKLDLHHNFISEALRQRLREALEPAGVEVDLDADGAEDVDEYDGIIDRYVAAGE